MTINDHANSGNRCKAVYFKTAHITLLSDKALLIKEQSIADYVDQFARLNEHDLMTDLATQIHRNAEIATEKHWWVRKSLIASFLGVIPWGMAIVLLVKF